MRKKFLPFSLLAITSVLLASCNQTPSLEAANNQNQVPALMSRAEEVPQALGQLIALNNSVRACQDDIPKFGLSLWRSRMDSASQ